jgi:DNA-binding transcriptional MerR regulator
MPQRIFLWKSGPKPSDFASHAVQTLAYTGRRAGSQPERVLSDLPMATHSTQKHSAAPSISIPDRLYFKIGDVAEICGLETYVLRFWESQFPQLKPTKSGTGQRLYRRRDVELVLEIKRLVHAEGYTLAGARQALEGVRRRDQSRLPMAETNDGQRLQDAASVIKNARAELREIAGLLASPEPAPSRRRARLTPVQANTESLFPS